ncbi:MAG: hypothetical protein LUQ69_10300 [Methanoregulaceae archaeon]|nr:hypothetical protein [Methanoregulaceae archaeon]
MVPLLYQILTTCPHRLLPRRSGYEWTFRNPAWGDPTAYSTFRIAGVNWRRGDRLRGTWADAIFLDEVREIEDLRYIVEDVLIPQFVGRDDPLLLMDTTPPKTMDHPWVQYFLPRAIAEGRYIEIPGSKNPDFSERDKELVLQAIGGDPNSTAYQREIECRLITDPEDLICPEFVQRKSTIVVSDYKRPEYFVPYVCMDSGFDPDHTAILFGHVNWHTQILHIEAEIFRRRMTLADINKAVRGTEARLWGKKPYHKARRIADIEKRGLADLARTFKLWFRPADKWHHEAGLAGLRTNLMLGKIRISTSCKSLIHQLEYGIWNKNRTDYERTDEGGHWDAGQALIYLNKMVRWKENPNPEFCLNPDREFGLFLNQDKLAATLLGTLGRK